MIEPLGPDKPWSEFWDKACSREGQGQLGGVDIPVDEIACSGPLAQRFARFSIALELMLRSRATEGEGDRRALGRGQRPEYRVVPVQPPSPLIDILTIDVVIIGLGCLLDWGSSSGPGSTTTSRAQEPVIRLGLRWSLRRLYRILAYFEYSSFKRSSRCVSLLTSVPISRV